MTRWVGPAPDGKQHRRNNTQTLLGYEFHPLLRDIRSLSPLIMLATLFYAVFQPEYSNACILMLCGSITSNAVVSLQVDTAKESYYVQLHF